MSAQVGVFIHKNAGDGLGADKQGPSKSKHKPLHVFPSPEKPSLHAQV